MDKTENEIVDGERDENDDKEIERTADKDAR